MPQISIWCVATRENIVELPELVRLAARVGVPEVYLQRMVFFAQDASEQYGMARQDLAIFDSALSQQEAIIAECEALSAELGIAFHASGARDLRDSLAAQRPAESGAVARLHASLDDGLRHSERQLPALLHLTIFHRRLRELAHG